MPLSRRGRQRFNTQGQRRETQPPPAQGRGPRREATPTQRGGDAFAPDYSGRRGPRQRRPEDHRATQPPQMGGFMGAVGGGMFGDSDRLSLARRAITGQLGDRAARGAMGGMAGRGGELRRAATGAAGGALFDRDRLGLAQRALTGQREGEGSNAFRRALTGGLF